MTIILIIVGIVIVLLIALSKSAAREANRIQTELDFRSDGLNARLTETRYLLSGDDQEAEKYERKAARLKARGEEVASRQTPLWKSYSKAVRKRR